MEHPGIFRKSVALTGDPHPSGLVSVACSLLARRAKSKAFP